MEQKVTSSQKVYLDKSLPVRPRETKEEKKERILGIAKDSIEMLAHMLAAGKSETLLNYLKTMAKFHKYSFGNVMLIAAQRPDATHVAGFNTWKKLNRSVIKGEKGIGIMAPVVYKNKDDDELKTNGDESNHRVRGFRIVHVFDVSQTAGEPLPQFAEVWGNPGERADRLRKLIDSYGIELRIEHLPGRTKGLSTGGTIVVQAGLSPGEEFAVMVHELAHELLHQTERRAETTTTIRETEAEAVAYVVCEWCGIATSTRSSDYIQIYQGDITTLFESLDFIQRTATEIITALQDPNAR